MDSQTKFPLEHRNEIPRVLADTIIPYMLEVSARQKMSTTLIPILLESLVEPTRWERQRERTQCLERHDEDVHDDLSWTGQHNGMASNFFAGASRETDFACDGEVRRCEASL